LGFGESGLIIPLRETLFNCRSHKLSIVSGLFFHLPQHHMAGSGAGYLDAFATGQGSDTGGLFSLAFFLPSSLVLKKKTYTQQCTTLGSSPRQKLLCGFFADIPGTFFFLLFPLFSLSVRFREASWKIPLQTRTTHNWHTHFASFFGLLPDSRRYYFNDDLFYDSMTNDYFFSDMIRFTSGITNNRLDVET